MLICDSVLPVMVYAFLQTILMCLGTVVVVVSVNPWLLLVLIPLLAAFVPFRRQFLNTSRCVRARVRQHHQPHGGTRTLTPFPQP